MVEKVDIKKVNELAKFLFSSFLTHIFSSFLVLKIGPNQGRNQVFWLQSYCSFYTRIDGPLFSTPDEKAADCEQVFDF